MASEHYPFGLAPADAFSTATCPACGGIVGPNLHYCPSCLATNDVAAARRDLVFRGGPEASMARVLHVGEVVTGALVASGYFVWPDVRVLVGGGALVSFGVIGALAFPRYPLASSLAAGVVVGLGALASLGALVVAIFATRGAGYAGGRAFAATLALSLVATRGVVAGVRVGRRVAGLKLIPRPVSPPAQ